jgi:hypothetical protein
LSLGFKMSRTPWLILVLGWDGALPLVVCLLPTWLDVWFPNRQRDLAMVSLVLLVPLIAALIRAGSGARQLRRFGLIPSLSRQLLFTCALIVLMFFESLSAVLQLGNMMNAFGGLIILPFYVIYLVLILLAFRPSAGAAPEPIGFSQRDDFL